MVEAPLARMVDANANRAAEALRVLEDLRRLGADRDATGAADLKRLRHGLREALDRAGIGNATLLVARDSARDPGRARSVLTAYKDAVELDSANWKRLQEALRVLEEAARLSDLRAARVFAALRFKTYELERGLSLAVRRRGLLADVRLYLVATPRPEGPPLERIIRTALRGGVGMVQLRVKGGSDREILRLARALGGICRSMDAPFVLNDRPDLAVLAGADGVHVGQGDVPVSQARRIVGPGRIVGLSTHSPVQARAAPREGADYVGYGPLYATPTKPGRRAIGLAGLRGLSRHLGIPLFAIGGVDRSTLSAILEAGATRVSVSRAILDSSDPRREAQALLRLLSRRGRP